MDKRIIALIIIVIIVVFGAIYILAIPKNNTNTTNVTNNNTSNLNKNESTNQNVNKTNNTANVKISAEQAEKIAEDASVDLGFPGTAGTPTLFRWTKNNRHTWVWNVPLTYSTGNVKNGSLYVDAENGSIIMNE